MRVAVTRSSSGDAVMLSTSGFVDDVMLFCNWPYPYGGVCDATSAAASLQCAYGLTPLLRSIGCFPL